MSYKFNQCGVHSLRFFASLKRCASGGRLALGFRVTDGAAAEPPVFSSIFSFVFSFFFLNSAAWSPQEIESCNYLKWSTWLASCLQVTPRKRTGTDCELTWEWTNSEAKRYLPCVFSYLGFSFLFFLLGSSICRLWVSTASTEDQLLREDDAWAYEVFFSQWNAAFPTLRGMKVSILLLKTSVYCNVGVMHEGRTRQPLAPLWFSDR